MKNIEVIPKNIEVVPENVGTIPEMLGWIKNVEIKWERRNVQVRNYNKREVLPVRLYRAACGK